MAAPALQAAADVHQLVRRRWPHLATWRRGERVAWVDGPAVLDVRRTVGRTDVPLIGDQSRTLAGADVGAHDLDLALQGDLDRPAPADDPTAVVLERRWSWFTLAAATLHALDHHLDAVVELDELRLYPIPAHGRPGFAPTSPSPACSRPPCVGSAERGVQVDRLAAIAPPIGPIRVVDPLAVRRATDVLRTVAATANGLLQASDPTVYRFGPRGWDAARQPRLPVHLPPWPELQVTAHIALPGRPPQVELVWTDGPTLGEVRRHLDRAGTPHPLTPDIERVCRRLLSPTAVAAAVLLYQRRYRRPYRDPTANAHWLQRWRSPSTREAEQGGRTARNRLHHLQRLLLDQSLPPDGDLEVAVLGAVDKRHLWHDATALTTRAGHDPDLPGYRPGNDARVLSADLADLAWRERDPSEVRS